MSASPMPNEPEVLRNGFTSAFRKRLTAAAVLIDLLAELYSVLKKYRRSSVERGGKKVIRKGV